MDVRPTDYWVSDDLVDAARELIRSHDDRCIVSIYDLLDELSDKFSDGFLVSPDTHKLLNLIWMLWDEPHIYSPDLGGIEFVWDEKRSAIESQRPH
jgi:hypothetical protein